MKKKINVEIVGLMILLSLFCENITITQGNYNVVPLSDFDRNIQNFA